VTVKVYFGQVSALGEGAKIVVAGRAIGEISSIVLVPAGTTGPDEPLHGEAGIVALARIEKRYAFMVPANGEFFVSSRSIFAPRWLEVGPPAKGAVPCRAVVEGDKVRGIDPPSLDQILQRTWDNLNVTSAFMSVIRPEADAFIDSVRELEQRVADAEPAPGAYGSLFASIVGLRLEIDRLDIPAWRDATGGLSGVLDGARALQKQLDLISTDLQTHIALLQAEFARLGAAAPPDLRDKIAAIAASTEVVKQRVDLLNARVRALVAGVAAGDGAIGSIANDPELLDDAKQLGKTLKRNPWKVLVPPSKK
jgi:uncharacterized small protein (DUF1192 family)